MKEKIEENMCSIYDQMKIKRRPKIIYTNSMEEMYKYYVISLVKKDATFLGKVPHENIRTLCSTDHKAEKWWGCPSQSTATVRDLAVEVNQIDRVMWTHIKNSWGATRLLIQHSSCKDANKPLQKLVKNTHIFSIYNKGCIISEDPILVKREEGRLHCAVGPAIEYSDGFKVYALQGIGIKKTMLDIVNKKNVHKALTIRNVEQLRVVLDEIGMEYVLDNLHAKRIDRSDYGELYEVDLHPAGEAQRVNSEEMIAKYCKVKDSSSDRVYFNRVPPTIYHVLEALAWRFNCTPEEYVFQAEA